MSTLQKLPLNWEEEKDSARLELLKKYTVNGKGTLFKGKKKKKSAHANSQTDRQTVQITLWLAFEIVLFNPPLFNFFYLGLVEHSCHRFLCLCRRRCCCGCCGC